MTLESTYFAIISSSLFIHCLLHLVDRVATNIRVCNLIYSPFHSSFSSYFIGVRFVDMRIIVINQTAKDIYRYESIFIRIAMCTINIQVNSLQSKWMSRPMEFFITLNAAVSVVYILQVHVKIVIKTMHRDKGVHSPLFVPLNSIERYRRNKKILREIEERNNFSFKCVDMKTWYSFDDEINA